MRLDKLLAHAGRGSRADVKRLISSDVVTVDGVVTRNAGLGISPGQDVRVNGEEAGFHPRYDLMLHKPAGVLTATTDPTAPTVLDLLLECHRKSGVVPVGRLDKDVTGLLLLTTDGKLAHRLTSPKHGAQKVYEAVVDGALTPEDIRVFAEGVKLKDFTALPARLEILAPNRARVTVTEGKYHQVKRMFMRVGKPVLSLRRTAMAGVLLDENLAPGEFRDLSAQEKRALGIDGEGF